MIDNHDSHKALSNVQFQRGGMCAVCGGGSYYGGGYSMMFGGTSGGAYGNYGPSISGQDTPPSEGAADGAADGGVGL